MKLTLKNMNQSVRESNDESLQHLSYLLTLIDNHQNTLQAIKQILTLKAQFNPETLFNYLTGDDNELTKKHIITVMEQNGEYVNEQQLRIVFILSGCKDKMNFSSFLNFVYPYNVEALKIISTVNAKKYAKNGNQALTEEILCLFLMIIRGEITFLHEFEAAKSEYFSRVSREKIKKVMKGIKKMNQLSKNCVHSDFVLKPVELKNFLKRMKKTPQNRINSVCRRLSIGKEEGLVSLQQLEFWLRPWNKIKIQDNTFYEKENHHKTLLEDITSQLQVSI